jgi:hypothetical protein
MQHHGRLAGQMVLHQRQIQAGLTTMAPTAPNIIICIAFKYEQESTVKVVLLPELLWQRHHSLFAKIYLNLAS